MRRGPIPIVSKVERAHLVTKHGYKRSTADDFYHKWRSLCHSAKAKGVSCHLSFNQYLILAKRAGISPDQIGRCKSQYQMARKGDEGDYMWGNCRFRTCFDNQQERKRNGGLTQVVRKLMAVPKADLGSRKAKPATGFVMVSPSGERYTGTNISHFARKHKLTASLVSRMLSGFLSHHKHWTGYYTYD